MIEREEMEWTDTWWEHADDDVLPRFLLIGDSITRDYHPFVRDALRGATHVDRFTTSKFASDPFFMAEIDLYLPAYRYEAIHLNHGLHGSGFPIETYETAYEVLVRKAMDTGARVVLATSTPDPRHDVVMLARNRVVQAIGAKYGLVVNDLYAAVVGNPALKGPDGLHFTPEGSELLAEKVCAALLAGR